jgi:hypothetical protein
MTVEGLDLSHWDNTSDYSLTGKGFVVIKSTEGNGYIDPSFDDHLAKAKAAKVLIGSYHWCRNDAPIDGQAQYFVDHTRDKAITFLALDNEGTFRMGRSQLASLFAAVRKYDDRNLPLLLYMSESVFLYNSGQDYNWPAKWGSTPPSGDWLLWQYASGSHNTSGEDQDRFDGSLTQLRAILGGEMTPALITDLTPKTITRSGSWYELDGVTVNSTGHSVGDSYSPYGIGNGMRAFYANGKTYLTKPTAVKAIIDPTQFDQTDINQAVKAQKALDQAALEAAATQHTADQAAVKQALADLSTAAATERERIAVVAGKQEADRIRSL